MHVTVDGESYDGQIVDKKEARRKYQSSVELNKAEVHTSESEPMYDRWTDWHIKVNSPSASIVNITLSFQEMVPMEKLHYRYIFTKDVPISTQRIKIEAYIKENRPLQIKNREFLIFQINSTEDANIYNKTPDVPFTQPSPKTFALDRSENFDEAKQLLNFSIYLEYGLAMEDNQNIADDIVVEDGYFVHLISSGRLQTEVSLDVVIVIDMSSHAKGIPVYNHWLEDIMLNWFPQDRFSLILYSSHVCVLRPLLLASHAVRKATAANVKRAKVGGGADINNALIAAMTQLNSRQKLDKPGMIILFSAGPATEGEKDSNEIVKNVATLNKNKSVVIYNIDYKGQSDRNLSTYLTLENNGFSKNIDSIKDLDSTLKYVRGGFVMTDFKVSYLNNSVDKKTLTKTRFPFLTRYMYIFICGRIKKDVETIEYEISGKTTKGAFSLTSKVVNASQRTDGNLALLFPSKFSIKKMWAMTTIIQLQDRKKIAENDEEVRATEKKIRDMSLKYSFLTPMTALVLNESMPRINGAVELFAFMNEISTNLSDKSDTSILKDFSWQNETSMDLLNSCSPIVKYMTTVREMQEFIDIWYKPIPKTLVLKLASLSVWDPEEEIYRGICIVPGKWPYGKIVLLHSKHLFIRVVVGMCMQHKCPKRPRPDFLSIRLKHSQERYPLTGETHLFTNRPITDFWILENKERKRLLTLRVNFTVDDQISEGRYEIHLIVYPGNKGKKSWFGGVLGHFYGQADNETFTGDSPESIVTSCKKGNPPQLVNIKKGASGLTESVSSDLQLITLSVGKYRKNTFRSICLSPKFWGRTEFILLQQPSVFGVNVLMCDDCQSSRGSVFYVVNVMWYQKRRSMLFESCKKKMKSKERKYKISYEVKNKNLSMQFSVKVTCNLDKHTFEPRYQIHLLMNSQSGIENLPWNFEGLLSYYYSRKNSKIVKGNLQRSVPKKCKNPKHRQVVKSRMANRFRAKYSVSSKHVDLITFSVRETHSNKSKSICVVPLDWFCGNAHLMRKNYVFGIYLIIKKKSCSRGIFLRELKIWQGSKKHEINFSGWKYHSTESVKIWETDRNKTSQKRLLCTTTVSRSLGINNARPKYQIHITLNLQPGDGDVIKDFKGLLPLIYGMINYEKTHVDFKGDCKDFINQQASNKPVG